MKIVNHPFSPNQYFATPTVKRQLVIHHTVSNVASVGGDIAWWSQSVDRIATAFIIGGDGTIFQLFDEKYWAHHLGVSFSGNKIPTKYKNREHNILLNKGSIAIEIDSAGPVRLQNNEWRSSFGSKIDPSHIITYPKPYRGYQSYERYRDVQIQALKELLLMLSKKYNIPTTYDEGIWDINERALKGMSGIFTHTSYRSDKSDCHYQPELVQMLKSLTAQ